MELATCEKDQWKHAWDQWTCSRWYFQVIWNGTHVCTSMLTHNIGNKSWKGSWVYYFNVHFCWFYICYFLGRLIPSPSILSKFAIDDGVNDELVSEMDNTTQDATNDMEIDLD
jgi:hypothetical protein